MFCYENLQEGYTPLNTMKVIEKPIVKLPSTKNKKQINSESDKGQLAQMLAMLSGIGLGMLGKNTAFAHEVQNGMIPVTATGDMVAKVTSAFDPLIDIMVGLSLPIAGVMLTAGALLIMIGQKEMGYKLLINCGMGYVLVNLTPIGMDILSMVGDAVGGA